MCLLKNINKEVFDFLKNQKKFTLGFSTGKDSLACALILKDLNIDFIPFYFYHVPELDFVNESILMYEDLLNIKIIQLPHPMLYDRIRHHDFQNDKIANWLANIDFPKMTFQYLIDAYLDSINDPNHYYDIVGMRAAESFNRREYFKKNGAINEKKKAIYPIFDWNKADVKNYIQLKKIPLTKDYAIWDRSWDGLKYQFVIGVKKHYPKDFEKIKEYFPLIDLEIARYEFSLGH